MEAAYAPPSRCRRSLPPVKVALCAGVTALWLAVAPSPAHQAVADPVEKGVEAMRQGNFAGAEKAFRDAIGANPRSARAWKALGVVYAAQQLHDQASEPFAKACSLDRKEPDACYYLARNHYLLNRFDDALAMFNRLALEAKGDWRFANGRGLALLALARYPEAEAAFRRAMETERGAAAPDESPAVNLGSLFSRSGQPEKALAVLSTFVQRQQTSARAWFELGKVQMQLERLEEARASLESALRVRPQHREAHLLISKVYSRLGDEAKAKDHRDIGLASRP